MNNQVTTIIRILVAAGVGYLVALAAKQGLPVMSPALQAAVITAITGVAAGVVNGALNWLEKRFPWLGHLAVVKHPRVPPKPGKA